MKRINVLSLALIALMACSKSDPAPVAATPGCKVKFKNVDYTMAVAVCGPNGAGQGLAATSTATGTTGALMSLGKGTASGDYITFSSDINNIVATSFVLVGGVPGPSVSVTGKNWTFSGTLVGGTTGIETGAISGTCTCTN